MLRTGDTKFKLDCISAYDHPDLLRFRTDVAITYPHCKPDLYRAQTCLYAIHGSSLCSEGCGINTSYTSRHASRSLLNAERSITIVRQFQDFSDPYQARTWHRRRLECPVLALVTVPADTPPANLSGLRIEVETCFEGADHFGIILRTERIGHIFFKVPDVN
jgi:hypothetical protein